MLQTGSLLNSLPSPPLRVPRSLLPLPSLVSVVGASTTNYAMYLSGSSQVWIDHVKISGFNSAAVGAVSGSTDITISNSLFQASTAYTVFQFGSQAAKDDPTDANRRVTLYRNVVDGLKANAPLVYQGSVHVANCLFNKWTSSVLSAYSRACVLSQASIYVPGTQREVAQLSNAYQDKTFSLISADDWLQDRATFSQQTNAGTCAIPYVIDDMHVADATLQQFLWANAGPQRTEPPPPPPPGPPEADIGKDCIYTRQGRADVTYCALGFATNPMRIVGGKQGYPVTVNTDVWDAQLEGSMANALGGASVYITFDRDLTIDFRGKVFNSRLSLPAFSTIDGMNHNVTIICNYIDLQNSVTNENVFFHNINCTFASSLPALFLDPLQC